LAPVEPIQLGGGEEYIAEAKSKNEIDRQGCLCLGCTVYEKYSLFGTYFCAGEK